MSTNEKIGQALKELRTSARRSPEWMADQLEVTSKTVQNSRTQGEPMTHSERAELRALASLLETWPYRDRTAIGYSGPRVAVVDAQIKNYAVHVTSVTL